jgi:hypothetical protein
VTLELTVKPAGTPASMTVDGKPFDHTVDGLSSGVEHKIVVSAPGYHDQTTSFLGNAMEKKQLEVTLERMPNLPHSSRTAATPASAASTSAPPVAGGSGKLNVSASGGWCNISVDGAAKGPTPVAGIELNAGPHRVICAPEGKAPLSTTITVPADGVVRHKFVIP